MKWSVSSTQEVAYEVSLSADLFAVSNPTLALAIEDKLSKRCLVVIDTNVNAIWGHALRGYLNHHQIAFDTLLLAAGEDAKNFDSVFRVVETMNAFHLNRRRDHVIAIGGGVVLDIVGLATSLFRRGASCIKIPTTLMGIVDAGIGVKTGVNFAQKKNRLGTYAAPASVLLDPSFVASQDRRHLANGVAEIIKMALISNRELFGLLEETASQFAATNFVGTPYTRIICAAVGDMLDQLMPNLWEAELNRLVDYGHTFSPTIELHAQPDLLHGEAVSIDMALSLALAYGRNLIDQREFFRSIKLIHDFGLPLSCGICTLEWLWSALEESTLHRDGMQRIPLTAGIGNGTFVNDVTRAELERALLIHADAIAHLQAVDCL